MKFSALSQSFIWLTASGVVSAQPGTTNASFKERAAALRDERFGNPSKKSSSSSPPLVQKRDLKPDEEGVSYHWAGAVVPAPSGENITSVTATMTLPDLDKPGNVRKGPAGEYFLYVWVGIDGLESVDPGECNALWQTGFAGQINNGVTTWWGWVCYLWEGEENVIFNTYILDASTGDTVNMTVEALDSSEGIFYLDNLTTGKSKSHSITGGDLCMQQAEWIVEDPWHGDTEAITYMDVWPDFGTMTFENAVAYTGNGTAVTPTADGSTSYVVQSYYNSSIMQNSVSITDSSVSVTWIESGPATELGA